MPAPKKLKIGYVNVKVQFLNNMSKNDSYSLLGLFHPDEGIKIDASLTKGTLADVFLHECLHAIFHYFSIEEERPEEIQVGQMASLLTTFWSANPSTLKWWSSLLKE